MVQRANPDDPRSPPTNEPFHRTLRRLTEVAEGAWTANDSEALGAAIGELILYTNDPIQTRSDSALETLLLLCLSGVAKPANLAHVGSDGRLARMVREFAQRFWRAGSPRPEDLLLLAFGHGLISQTALGRNVPDKLLAISVRERMRTQ